MFENAFHLSSTTLILENFQIEAFNFSKTLNSSKNKPVIFFGYKTLIKIFNLSTINASSSMLSCFISLNEGELIATEINIEKYYKKIIVSILKFRNIFKKIRENRVNEIYIFNLFYILGTTFRMKTMSNNHIFF